MMKDLNFAQFPSATLLKGLFVWFGFLPKHYIQKKKSFNRVEICINLSDPRCVDYEYFSSIWGIGFTR